MNDVNRASFSNTSEVVSLDGLPRTALQAIYHAVTGKTENLFKVLFKNVIISHNEFCQLHERVLQQIEHYNLITGPTVTIIVKYDDGKSQTYSSWQRFQYFQANSSDITSEISIKFEFIIRLPNTGSDQRCIVSVSLDSGLPIVIEKDDLVRPPLFGLMMMSSQYRTAEISIDFVDFLVAKNFAAVVEEWFNTLDEVPKPKLMTTLINSSSWITSGFRQLGRVGMAVFLISYIYFNHGSIGESGHFVYSIGMAVIIWSGIAIAAEGLSRRFMNLLRRNIIPSVILMTDADKKAYDKIANGRKSISLSLIEFGFASIAAVLLNVASSYIYSYLNHA